MSMERNWSRCAFCGDLFNDKDRKPIWEHVIPLDRGGCEHLANLVRLIDKGEISGKMAKQVFEKLYETGADPQAIIAQEDLKQISDESQLAGIVDRILESNPDKVEAYQAGKAGLLGFFMGQVMKETRGQANPEMVSQMLEGKLRSSP